MAPTGMMWAVNHDAGLIERERERQGVERGKAALRRRNHRGRGATKRASLTMGPGNVGKSETGRSALVDPAVRSESDGR